jgi:predicted ester cyclase
MNSVATEAKQFVLDYIQALSGNPKPKNLLDRFVSDPGLTEHVLQAEAAFPNYELIAHQVIADGDLVAVRGTIRGIHQGEFAGIKPTGKRISSDLMIIYRVRDGLIVEHWMQFDFAGLSAQLSQ